jgi:hypothetical protein
MGMHGLMLDSRKSGMPFVGFKAIKMQLND